MRCVQRLIRLCLVLTGVLALTACRERVAEEVGQLQQSKKLVIARSAGPKTFNRLFSLDEPTSAVTDCLTAYLAKINRQTQRVEAELARAWQTSADGRSITFTLRPEVKFSDGRPFTAADVLFSFKLVSDPEISSAAADLFRFDGGQVRAEELDAQTVRFNFPQPVAEAERLFDGLPILPRHALEEAYRAGRLGEAWSLAAPPDQIVGLGPFRLKEYVPGQRVILTRNEHYWKTDAAGKRLPYLTELIFEIVPDRNAQLLKFQNGETDLFSPVSAEDLRSLVPLEQQGKIKLHDLGPSLIREVFWFNLNDGRQKQTSQPLVDPLKLKWFREKKFRQAVSHAIDREAIVRLVFAGKASPQFSFISAGDQFWHDPEVKKYPLDPDRARRLLIEAGFRWRADQKLLDAQGTLVAFTLLTNAGNALRQKMATMIQADLAKLGIEVSLATLDAKALLSRINETRDYEAGLLAIVSGDVGPASALNFLLSSGASHWWNPQQARPATEWEARLDDLMKRQMTTIDPQERKRLFSEAQTILAEEQPFIFLATRHLIVAAKPDVANFKPALLPDFVLWNCEELDRKN